MPFYEYECESCGHQFEKLMKMGASAPPCPECALEQVRKRVSIPNFHLKGGGWYKDGYGSTKPPSKSGSDNSGSDSGSSVTPSSDSSKSSGSSDSKSAPTPTATKSEG